MNERNLNSPNALSKSSNHNIESNLQSVKLPEEDNQDELISVRDEILNLFENKDKAMSLDELTDRLHSLAYERQVFRRKIRKELAILTLDGKIKRLKDGVYAHLDFCEIQFEIPQNTTKGILESLENETKETFVEAIVTPVQNGDILIEEDEPELKQPKLRPKASKPKPTGWRSRKANPKQLKRKFTVKNSKKKQLKPNQLKRRSKETKPRRTKEEMLLLQNEIIKILEEKRVPMSLRQINDAVAQIDREQMNKELKNYSWYVSELIRLGQIKRIGKGVYAALEFDVSQYGKPINIREGVTRLLQNNNQIMTAHEILNLFNETYNDKIDKNSLQNCLRVLKKRGIVKSLKRGLYANAEFDESEYEKQTPTEDKILKILKDSGQMMSTDEIESALKEFGEKIIKRPALQNTLSSLFIREKIKRSGWGVYADIKFDDSKYEKYTPIKDRILKILKDSGRAMSNNEIANCMNKLDGKNIKKTEINSNLSILSRQREIKRVRSALYIHPEFVADN